MTGTIDITDYFFGILNVPELTTELSGKIYKEARNLNNEDENVIIITNSLNSGRDTAVQKGITNINLEIPTTANGQPKLNRFRILTDIIRKLIIEYNRKNGYYYELIYEALIRDNRQNESYYYNFKILNLKI